MAKFSFFREKMLASKFTVPSSVVSHNAAALLLQCSLEGRCLVAFKKLKLTSFRSKHIYLLSLKQNNVTK